MTHVARPAHPDAYLLDPAPLLPSTLAGIEQQLARLLGSDAPVVVFQAEAILALEAVATALAAPGRAAINVATGPYGVIFGDWMRRAGARVVDVESALDSVATVEQVVAALDAHPDVAVLALAHAEAATGGSNPVTEIVRAARERGVVTVVDAVASVGAEPVDPTAWGADVCVIGPQKALAGPAGISAATVSDRAWDLAESHPAPLRRLVALPARLAGRLVADGPLGHPGDPVGPRDPCSRRCARQSRDRRTPCRRRTSRGCGVAGACWSRRPRAQALAARTAGLCVGRHDRRRA